MKKGQEAIGILKDNNIVEDELKAKIYSRMVKSLVSLKKYDEAVKVGQEGVESIKDGTVIQKEVVKAKQLLKEEEEKKREMYKKMMTGSFRGDSGRGAAGNEAEDAKGL